MVRDPDYDREYQLARYHRIRAEALELLGGQCATCGSTEDLQIDHVDPAAKSFSLSKTRTSREKWLVELKKCQLLCRSHHKQKTSSEQRRDVHGTWGMIRNRKCRCRICRDFQNAYAREWKRKKRAELKK